jgi:hypothetical protein
MAQTARTETDRFVDTAKDATGNGAELGKRTTDKIEDAARSGFRIMERTPGAALEIEHVVARRSAEGATELGQAFTELLNEQARHNIEVFKALKGTVDWDAVVRIQSEFVRSSMEQAALFTLRYFEAVQAVMLSAATATKDEARKAA